MQASCRQQKPATAKTDADSVSRSDWNERGRMMHGENSQDLKEENILSLTLFSLFMLLAPVVAESLSWQGLRPFTQLTEKSTHGNVQQGRIEWPSVVTKQPTKTFCLTSGQNRVAKCCNKATHRNVQLDIRAEQSGQVL